MWPKTIPLHSIWPRHDKSLDTHVQDHVSTVSAILSCIKPSAVRVPKSGLVWAGVSRKKRKKVDGDSPVTTYALFNFHYSAMTVVFHT